MTRLSLLSLAAVLLALAGGVGLHGDVARTPSPEPLLARGRIMGKVTRRHAAGKEGVANVVVWVQPEAGRAFTLEPDDLDPVRGGWQREVVMKASAKALVPEMVVLFPAYQKPGVKKPIRTGQTFAIDNRDREVHAVAVSALPGSPNVGAGCKILQPQTLTPYELWPDRFAIFMRCCIHHRMVAYVWAFDHPFAAVTNRAGEYAIKNVPAGVPLRIQAWHPETGWLARHGKAGDPIDVPLGRTREYSFIYEPVKH